MVQEHLRYGQEQVADGWDLIHQEGEMKVYRREVEEDGIVVDPLKIFHTIQVISRLSNRRRRSSRSLRVSPVTRSVGISGMLSIEWNGKVGFNMGMFGHSHFSVLISDIGLDEKHRSLGSRYRDLFSNA